MGKINSQNFWKVQFFNCFLQHNNPFKIYIILTKENLSRAKNILLFFLSFNFVKKKRKKEEENPGYILENFSNNVQ